MASVGRELTPWCRSVPKWVSIGYVNIGIIFLFLGNSQIYSHNTQVNSDWLSNTQSRVLQAFWYILEINEKTTLNIYMPHYKLMLWLCWLNLNINAQS